MEKDLATYALFILHLFYAAQVKIPVKATRTIERVTLTEYTGLSETSKALRSNLLN